MIINIDIYFIIIEFSKASGILKETETARNSILQFVNSENLELDQRNEFVFNFQ